MQKKILLASLTFFIASLIALSAGEVMVRLIAPVDAMYPRWDFSPEYGLLPYPNSVMVHEVPGKWKFTYTTNDIRTRRRTNPTASSKPAIVLLGDSFTFGMGVNDGEEYASVVETILSDRFQIVNTGCGGWGITQEIRRFYDFGLQYTPHVVVLQFASNDPEDNLNYRVTRLEQGDFVFENSQGSLNWLKTYLSRSIVQRSQLYNYIREMIYVFVKDRRVGEAQQALAQEMSGSASAQEVFHNQLLEAFAHDLKRRGIVLVMIAVNNSLTSFPSIQKKVDELDSLGLLHYLEVMDWINDDWLSAEGLHWNAKAHAIIGKELALFIESLEARRS
jgi:lysophospholipase L1-like esterase